MWISKKKHEELMSDAEVNSWEESRQLRLDDRQNEKIERLEEGLKDLKKQVKKLEKYIKEGY